MSKGLVYNRKYTRGVKAGAILDCNSEKQGFKMCSTHILIRHLFFCGLKTALCSCTTEPDVYN